MALKAFLYEQNCFTRYCGLFLVRVGAQQRAIGRPHLLVSHHAFHHPPPILLKIITQRQNLSLLTKNVR